MTQSNGQVQPVLTTAESYLAAGLSLLPIRRDGSKAPAIDEWKWLEQQLPTAHHLAEWFGGPRPSGIGIIGGAVSGNLAQLDFDRHADLVCPQWRDLVEEEAPGLIERLCLVKT